MKKTMKDFAREALQVQDACNLSGVVHSWSRMLPELRECVEEECKQNNVSFSTDLFNAHHINVMFANKIASLSGATHDDEVSVSFAWANGMVKE